MNDLADAAQLAADRIWEARLRTLDLPDWFIEGQAAARKLERWGDADT